MTVVRNKLGKVFIFGGSSEMGLKITNLISKKVKVHVYDKNFTKDFLTIRKSNTNISYEKIDLLDIKKSIKKFSTEIDKYLKNNTKPISMIYCVRHRTKTNSLEEINEKDYYEMINLCLNSAVFLSKIFVNKAPKRSTAIFISSLSSNFVSEESIGYQIAKSGLNQLTKYIAVSYKEKALRALSILPGLIIQDRHEDIYMSKNNANYRKICETYQPNGKVGSTNDVANTVNSILFTMPEYLNGQMIVLDGGASVVDHFNTINKL